MNRRNSNKFSSVKNLFNSPFLQSRLRFLCAVTMFMFVPVWGAGLQAQTASIQEMQELVQRWIIIEQQETALIIDWQRQQQIMRQGLLLLEEEKAQLNALKSANTSDSDAVTQRRLVLLELQNTAESDQARMERALQLALVAINSLHPQLPPPLVKDWQSRLDALATQTNDSTNSNFKLQALLEMLTQLQDFQQRINLNEDIIITSDGSEILVKQLYLGLSHAWYVSADGQFSGYGQSQPQGWVWLNDPQVDADTVQQAIAMLERNVDVQLIKLPLILQAPILLADTGANL